MTSLAELHAELEWSLDNEFEFDLPNSGWREYTTKAWLTKELRTARMVYVHDETVVQQVIDAVHERIIYLHQQPTHCRGQRTLALA